MTLRRMLSLALALLVGSLLWAASPAGATENPDYTAPAPTTTVTSPTPTTGVKTAVAVTPVRTRLAITGSDSTALALIGGSCVALGVGILVVRRRRIASL
jgi:LPXTG-motif cell wall-anchored protein